jgi:hypothetical protein
LTLKGGGGHSGTQKGGDEGLTTDRTAIGDEEEKGEEEKREVESKKRRYVLFTENRRNTSIMRTSHPHDIKSQNLTNVIVTVILEIQSSLCWPSDFPFFFMKIGRSILSSRERNSTNHPTEIQ